MASLIPRRPCKARSTVPMETLASSAIRWMPLFFLSMRDARVFLTSRVIKSIHGEQRQSSTRRKSASPRQSYFSTTLNFVSIKSTEFPPTMIRNVPGSTTRCISRFK